jgi:flap endonuclease-1
MAIYQFLIAVRVAGRDGVRHTLTTESGEDTSHLQGFFWRTIAMLRNGIKPLYVFDGKPPELKSGEIAKRNSRREEGASKLKEAEDLGMVDDMNKFSKRTLRVTKQHNEDCKTLLKLMGIPTLDAPCEAEAQCAALCKAGLVFATATEDMDALCCGSPILVRRLTFSEARNQPVLEYHLDKVLEGLQLNMSQFVDFCILCGCDFAGTIKGIGPKTALTGIRKHNSIEAFLKTLNTTKHPPPEPFPLDEVRSVLSEPEVVDAKNLSIQWDTPPDEDGLIAFLVKDKGFSEQRVRNGLEALKKARRSRPQGRLDSFFKLRPQKTAPGPSKASSPKALSSAPAESERKGNVSVPASEAAAKATGISHNLDEKECEDGEHGDEVRTGGNRSGRVGNEQQEEEAADGGGRGIKRAAGDGMSITDSKNRKTSKKIDD